MRVDVVRDVLLGIARHAIDRQRPGRRRRAQRRGRGRLDRRRLQGVEPGLPGTLTEDDGGDREDGDQRAAANEEHGPARAARRSRTPRARRCRSGRMPRARLPVRRRGRSTAFRWPRAGCGTALPAHRGIVRVDQRPGPGAGAHRFSPAPVRCRRAPRQTETASVRGGPVRSGTGPPARASADLPMDRADRESEDQVGSETAPGPTPSDPRCLTSTSHFVRRFDASSAGTNVQSESTVRSLKRRRAADYGRLGRRPRDDARFDSGPDRHR